MATYEIEIKVSKQTKNIGPPGVTLDANLEVYNDKVGLIIPDDFLMEIPGGILNVDDTLIVRLINDLPAPISSGIHWHGIELQSNADGTPVTQSGVPGGDLQELGGLPGDWVGGTYLYKFKVPRPGIFWFHPHHFHSTNRVFRGSYGMLIVTDPNEASLISTGVLPNAINTKQIVLSDITVCGVPGNPANNPPYDLTLPWAGPGGVLTAQPGFSPLQLCDTAAVDEQGNSTGAYGVDDVPNIQQASGRINEGLIVLTNGENVGPRGGTPSAPAAIVPADVTMTNVQPGQGLRLQIVNCATTRYFRLLVTRDGLDAADPGGQVELVRIGGEGGLLDNAILEGGTIVGFETKYDEGEILIPPSSRADVVVAVPDDASGTLTMWTQDFQRLPGQGGWTNTPTVPVLHLNVTGAVIAPAYTIDGGVNGVGGTALRASIAGQAVNVLGVATDTLLDPTSFSPAKPGMAGQDIQLTSGTPGINGISGSFGGFNPYTSALHINSSRYAKEDDLLELTVTNNTSAHHPFHLHGFSFQPKSLTRAGFPTYTWPYNEFRDTVDVPDNYTLTFRVHIEDRTLNDGVTVGGALGRWLFHCHIFFHAHRGMLSELVITDTDGSGDEKPNIDVGGSWTYAPSGGIATREGTYFLPDGDTVTSIISHEENGNPIGDITFGGNTWEWQSHTPPNPALADDIYYVYVTITGMSGRKDQTVFRLQIGAPDEGSDNGDPHIHTVDGKRYDFQAVGEFTLLQDREGMEIQTRQTPVLTANPITDSYSGLKACVSLNTAVAARVGSHRIAYQPVGDQGELQFYLDGKPARLTTAGMDLDGHHVSGFDVNGQTALRIDYAHHAVLTVTPLFWNSHSLWYMNISVTHTHGNEGIMSPISNGGWLPKLRSGADLGPMPEILNERYIQLYRTFADSWRVSDNSSLFVYESGTSTASFTDKDWPAQEPPCNLKPQFEIPGAPLPAGTDIANATVICQEVTDGGLNQDCIFDVATTGDAEFAQGYLILQDLRLNGTTVQIISDKKTINQGESVNVTAIVLPMRNGQPTPKGKVTFHVDGAVSGPSVDLDTEGRSSKNLSGLSIGEHKIRATYDSGGTDNYHPSGSPSLLIAVEKGITKPKKPWYFWLVLILIILLLLVLIIFLIK